jgi:AcrR family transcriptional regulator
MKRFYQQPAFFNGRLFYFPLGDIFTAGGVFPTSGVFHIDLPKISSYKECMNERSLFLETELASSTPSNKTLHREQIISAAYHLFLDQGYHGSSMRQIARLSHLSLASLYNYFPSKEEIFRAVFDAHHPYHDLVPAMVNAQGETIDALVRNAAKNTIRALSTQPDLIKLMFIEVVEFQGEHLPGLYQTVLPDLLSFTQKLEHNDQQLIDIPTTVILRAFLGLFYTFYMTELLMGHPTPSEPQDASLGYLVDIFLNGIIRNENEKRGLDK